MSTSQARNGRKPSRTTMLEALEPRLLLAAYPFELELAAGGAGPEDSVGRAVAVDGQWAVVGSPMDDGLGGDAGAAYLYRRAADGSWSQVKKLTAQDGGAGDLFGISAAIQGETLVVGASGDSPGGVYHAGSAYVFRRDAGGTDNWGQVRKIIASDGGVMAGFGNSVSIDGDVAAVAAWYDSSRAGSAYIFSRDLGGANNWGQTKKLQAFDAAANDCFGTSLSLSGATLLVGSPLDDEAGGESGSVYVFDRDGGGSGNWGLARKLTAGGAVAGDRFGTSVALAGDVAIVGAAGRDVAGNESGAAYVFSRDFGGAGQWGQVREIIAADGKAGDQFGSAVAVRGATAVVGAAWDDDRGNESGSAYVFRRDAGGTSQWGQVQQLTASDGSALDSFGASVATDGDSVLVGAYLHSGAAVMSGGAYVFYDVPVGVADSYGLREGGTLTVPASGVLSNDTNSKSLPLTAMLVTGPSHGSLTLNADGSFTYIHDGSETTADSFTYRPVDGTAYGTTATVAIAVTPVNDPPNGTNLNQSLNYLEDAASVAIGDIVVSDPDIGEVLTATLTLADASAGTLTTSGGGSFAAGVWSFTGSVSALNAALAAVAFVPAADYDRDTSIAVRIADGGEDGAAALTGAIMLDVTPVNDAPLLAAANPPIVSEDAGAQTVVGWAAFTPGPAGESVQTVAAYTVSAISNLALFAVAPSVSTSGTLTYQLAANANGTTTFQVVVRDNGGTANGGVDTSAAKTFTLTVLAVNDAPAASAGAATTDEDTFVDVDLWPLVTDVETPDAGLIFSVGGAANGTAVLRSDGHTVRFTPAANFFGAASFTYSVTDGGDGASPATTVSNTLVNITVKAVNDPPVLDIPIPDQETHPDWEYSYAFVAVTFHDDDPGDILTYTAERVGGGSLPAWLSFDPITRIFSGKSTAADLGTVTTIRVTARDPHGATATDEFVLSVVPYLGRIEGISPIAKTRENLLPFFDEKFYLSAYPDVAAAVAAKRVPDALAHFIQFGLQENRRPSLYFDETYYLRGAADVVAAIHGGLFSGGFDHYFQFGQQEGRNPCAMFNEEYYLRQNPDVAQAVRDGVFVCGFEHYRKFGEMEGRDPSLMFMESWYLKTYADVAAAVARHAFRSGFDHFLTFGMNEGRNPSPYFDNRYYLSANLAVSLTVAGTTYHSGFEQYLAVGARDTLDPIPYFDESWYLAAYPDVAAGVQAERYLSGLEHYLGTGMFEGRDPSGTFDESWYLSHYTDVAAAVAAGVLHSGFEHYVLYGHLESRLTRPV